MREVYQVLVRNERVDAAQVTPGSLVFFHIERWGGSYQFTITSVEVNGDKVTLIDDCGHKHILFSTTSVWVREYEERKGLNMHFYVTVFSFDPDMFKQFHSQDMNKVNAFMENTKNYPANATFHLEAIQQGIVFHGMRDTVDRWVSQRYHWYQDGYSRN